jgi:hypothetical protein
MREVKVEGVDKKGWLFGWCVCSQRGIPEMLLPHLTVEFEDGTVKDYPLEKVTRWLTCTMGTLKKCCAKRWKRTSDYGRSWR